MGVDKGIGNNGQNNGLQLGFNHGGGESDDHRPCFVSGTRVMTPSGEVAIEDLRIGGLVVTLSGEAKPIKWIGRRRYSAEAAASDTPPILIRAGALGKGLPRRDLFLSANHALALEGVLIEAAELVNGVSVCRPPGGEKVEYLNLEFAAHEIIFAEGVAVESYVDRNTRQRFDNWREYATLYPNEPVRHVPYAAPRVTAGVELELARRRIDALAEVGKPAAVPGPLVGSIDRCDWNRLSGWVADSLALDEAVVLEVVIDGKVIGELVANQYRSDLERAGHGNGRHGFRLMLDEALSPNERHLIELRRVPDHATVPGSPFMLEAAAALDEAGRRAMAEVLAAAAEKANSSELDQAIGFLLAEAEEVLQSRTNLAGGRDEREQILGSHLWFKPIEEGKIARAGI